MILIGDVVNRGGYAYARVEVYMANLYIYPYILL